MKPIVAIVGRPNVGKSTLFNRITRTKDALVDDLPGVTRDRHYGDARWNDIGFTLVDTGGLTRAPDAIARMTGAQAQAAIDESDLVLLCVDARAGLNAEDERIAVRKTSCDAGASGSGKWASARMRMSKPPRVAQSRTRASASGSASSSRASMAAFAAPLPRPWASASVSAIRRSGSMARGLPVATSA